MEDSVATHSPNKTFGEQTSSSWGLNVHVGPNSPLLSPCYSQSTFRTLSHLIRNLREIQNCRPVVIWVLESRNLGRLRSKVSPLLKCPE